MNFLCFTTEVLKSFAVLSKMRKFPPPPPLLPLPIQVETLSKWQVHLTNTVGGREEGKGKYSFSRTRLFVLRV